MAELDQGRVAEVIARTDDGRPAWRGSGYRVTSGAVLTAAHVVAGAGLVWVRFNADLPEEWSVPARLEISDPATDIAVLSIVPRVPGEEVVPALFGALGSERAEPLDCTAVGFPRFKFRDDPRESPQGPLSRYRDSHQANGIIAPLGNWRERTLEILVPPPAPDPDPKHSPWEGMSGAAVWCKGRIIGVISRHHLGDGLGSLAAARIERLYGTLDIQALASARELAGLPAQREQLVDVSDPAYAGVMECPYRGLQPFTSDDARFFFGRREVVTHLLQVLAKQPFVALVGASGSGKSSVLSAGLIPAASAAAGAGPAYHCARITPTADPVRQLADAVSKWSGISAAGLREDLPARIAENLSSRPMRVPPLLLIADQMEELHTLCADEQARRAFIRGLLALIGDDSPHNRVVIGVRTDFYAECAEDTDLGPAMDNRQVNLRPMGKAELRSIIEQPAALTGLAIDPRLTEMLLADVGDEPGKLPLLSHALLATFERRQGPQLTVEDYLSVGRVQGALNKSADEAYESLDSGGRDVAQAIFIRCTAGDGTIPDTRRPVRRADLDPETFPGVDAVLNRLAAARLLTLTDGQADENAGAISQQTVEVAHEVLIRSWGRLKGWLEAYRRYRPVHQDLIAAAGKWDMSGRPAGRLYHGVSLAEARKLLTTDSAVRLTRTERDFVLASQAAAKSRTRRIRLLALGLAVALLVGAGAAFTAVNQGSQKDAQHRLALAHQLASTSQSLLNTNLAVAQLVAVEAYHTHQDPQTLAALFQALTASPHLVRSIQVSGTISTTAASADGHVMLAGTQDGSVLKWPLAVDRIGDHEERMARLNGVITAIATNADGRTGAAIDDNAMQIWPAGQYAASFRIPAGQNPKAVGVSPSGRFVVVATEVAQGNLPPQLLLFDRATGRTTHAALRGVGIYPDWIAIPNDTQIVAFNGGDGAWERFSIPSLKRVAESTVGLFGTHDYAAALSANGRLFSYTNAGPQLPLWTTSGLHTLDHPSLIAQTRGATPVALALSADGSRAALADNTTIYVSTPAPPSKRPETPTALTGAGPITEGSLAFVGSDGNRLVSASGDSLTLWDLRQYSRIGTEQSAVIPASCPACVGPRIALQEQGGYVAIVGGDGLGVSLNVETIGSATTDKEPQRVLSLHNVFGGIRALWDGNGKRIILVSPKDDSAEIRSVSPGLPLIGTWPAPPNPLQLPDPASLLQLMPDGRRVIEVSASGSLKIRDAATGKILHEVTGPADMAPTADGAEALRQSRATLNSQATYAAVIDGNSHDIYVTDIATGHARVIHEGDASGVGFIRDRLLIQRETGALEIWNASGSNSFGTIRGTPGSVVGPVADGNIIAETDTDGSVQLLDYPSGYPLATLTVPTGDSATSTSLEFSPDGTQLITATAAAGDDNTGEVIDWKIDPGTLIRIACASAGHDITVGEWRQYIGTPIPPDLHCMQ